MKRMGWRAISTIAWGVLGALILIGCTRAEPSPQAAEQIAEPLAAGSLLQVSPPVSSIPATVQRQFRATLLGPNRRPRTSSSDVTWTVDDPGVATVDPTGLVTAIRPGQVTVTAAYQGLTATAALTVSSATLASIQVTPPLRRILAGGHAVFRATGTFSDGTTFPLGSAVTWTSSDADIAIVDSTGSATGITDGVVAVEATDTATGESAKAFLTVGSASLRSLTIAPAAARTTPGSRTPFVAVGTFADNSMQDLTDTAAWSSSNASVAAISNAPGTEGVATAAATGSAKITAVVGRRMATARLTVIESAALTSITITPATGSLPNGMTEQLVATGMYSDHTARDITALVAWMSSSAGLFVSNASGSNGLATAMTVGTATITASDPATGITGTAALTVTSAVLKSLAISPPAATVPLGLPQQFQVTGTYTDSTIQDVTKMVTWSSTSQAVATASNSPESAGLASTLSVGATTIGAFDPTSGLTANASLVVTAAALVSIAVTPPSPTLGAGTAQQFAATGTYTDGTMQDLTQLASWVSSDPSVLGISGVGSSVVSGIALLPGVASLSATAGTIVGSTTITVICEEQGQMVCNGACVDPSSDPANCGACGIACPGGTACQAGVCVAPPFDAGQGDASAVDSEETALGGPDGADASEEDGGLVATCSQCSGQCVDLTSDVANCGGCGNACAAGDVCTDGTCQCLGTLCNGQCVNTANDLLNCGACGNPCTVAGQICSGGVCQCFSFPFAPPLMCNGICVDILTDSNNCGGCGRVCPRRTGIMGGVGECAGGSCLRRL